MYGDSARKENDWAFHYMPKVDRHAFHAESEHPLTEPRYMLSQKLGPGIVAIHLRHVVERPVVFLPGGVTVHGFQKETANLGVFDQ